jgi:uncharacterized protein (UPF0218 family)
MPVSYAVTDEVLSKFKTPFGTLIEGSFSETTTQLSQLIQKEKPSVVIAIGDTVTRNLNQNHIQIDIAITDNKTLRHPVPPQTLKDKKTIHIQNPQGLITQQAIQAIQQALQDKVPIHMQVEGEEDLLTLPVVMYAPKNALVIYGQPNRGIVAVKVTEEKRAEAQQIWKKMKTVED